MRGFRCDKGKTGGLEIDGVPAAELAARYGTPLFVFSEQAIRGNVSRLTGVSRDGGPPIKVCYASKANSNFSILRAVREAGSDVEVNSGGELFKALAAGFSPEQIVFNGSAKDEREVFEAIEAGIYAIQADSFCELELIAKVAERSGKRANVTLRLVPEIKSDTLHGLQTALVTSKFGMMPDEGVEAFRRWGSESSPLSLNGIHIHIGSQTPSAHPYEEAMNALYREAKRVFLATGSKVRHFNIGGGFPVNYLADDPHAAMISEEQRRLFSADLDPAAVLRSAWERTADLACREGHSDLLEGIELVTEPGRSIIADAGICLTTVRNEKARPLADGETDRWLLTDAGFNILLSMETYKWYYRIVSVGRYSDAHDTPYRMAGPLCDGGDVYFDIEGKGRLPEHRLLPEGTGMGDVLALLNCGAYSVAQMYPYNGRALPAVLVIRRDGSVEVARKRDEYEDLLRNEEMDQNEATVLNPER